ncbi:fimbrillin family protein [Xylanibacter muris]|uniref:Fimbrillin family protein n=1 Tax=Xylanibacter muris TaxID=2736290 RepID=A0ABX2AP26_9BACT|nr:fimbrillin family protein [Xylanibacter muris]NPD92505.1 fimbrillin family protein [Xylanibacter muris]
MKKYICYLGLGLLAMAASCSNEDMPETGGSDIVISNSDVPIRLSSSPVGGTRASVESDGGLFEADGLGIFCLAKNTIGRNAVEPEIDWSTGGYAVWLNNTEANARKNKSKTATMIDWADGVSRWYPTGNWYSYRFYGYYPRTENIRYTESSVVAVIPIDGTQDLIWGRTDNLDDSEGNLAYSAAYFRSASHKNETPSIAFTHKFMRLTFSMVPGVDADGTINEALNMGIESIKINNVPDVAYLTVADREDITNDGTVSYEWDKVTYFCLCDSGDVALRDDHFVRPTETTIGQGILLPVPVDGVAPYTVEVTLKDKSGNVFHSDHPMTIRFANADGKFEAGKSYNIKLTINGAKTVGIDATLTGWVTDNSTLNGSGIIY